MDRLDNPSKIKAFELADELKTIMQPLYAKHQDDIITGDRIGSSRRPRAHAARGRAV